MESPPNMKVLQVNIQLCLIPKVSSNENFCMEINSDIKVSQSGLDVNNYYKYDNSKNNLAKMCMQLC